MFHGAIQKIKLACFYRLMATNFRFLKKKRFKKQPVPCHVVTAFTMLFTNKLKIYTK